MVLPENTGFSGKTGQNPGSKCGILAKLVKISQNRLKSVKTSKKRDLAILFGTEEGEEMPENVSFSGISGTLGGCILAH